MFRVRSLRRFPLYAIRQSEIKSVVMTTDFFTAIKKGDFGEVKKRLEADPGLIHAREKGLSPILVAVYHRQPEIAEFLVTKTVALNIFEAAATGRTTHIIRLLAHEPQLVNAYADDGFQPLGLACFFGHFETAEYLVKAGAPVNSPSRNALNVTPCNRPRPAAISRLCRCC